MIEKIKEHWMLVLLALVVLVAGGYFYKARAADKGGAVYRSEAASLSPQTSWNGCGAGVHGGGVFGDMNMSAVAVGEFGEAMGAHLVCDFQLGRGAGSFVIGAEGDYDMVWGDLHKLGVDGAWTGEVRGGVLVTNTALLYGHGGYRRVVMDTSVGLGISHLDGWVYGGGVELRLPTHTPLFLDTRYTYATYDLNPLCGGGGCGGLAASSHEIRLGVTWKFQAVPVLQ